uniref:Purple acid phosphatase n=1 Tax=Chloropicon roscoffensis TaxID=1461544 RepID=A0A7S2TA94_9CHLO
MASESARAPSRAAALGLVGLLFCAMAALRVCADGTLGPRDLKKAKLVKGGDGSDYYYADNLAPGFASELCKDHGSAIGVFRGPYLQAGGHDRVIVRWSSEAQGFGVVCYGTSPGNMASVAFDEESFPRGTEHSVSISGLLPSTEYYYVVAVTSAQRLAPVEKEVEAFSGWGGSPRAEEDSWSFLVEEVEEAGTGLEGSSLGIVSPGAYHSFSTFPRPLRDSPPPVRVWAIGDSGMGDDNARRVRDAFLNFTGGDWDLTLGLGDLAYGSGREYEYQRNLFDVYQEQNARIPIFTTPGNHDRPTSDMWKQTGPYFDLFTNPGDGNSGGVASNHKSYYSFDYGKVHFVSVDSDQLGLEDDPALYAWLERDLEAASKAGYDWIVAYHHQPPYSKGSHDSDREYECYKLRSNLVPTFEKYGVDLVLAGHSHSYERSHLLDRHLGSSGEIYSNPGVVKARWSKDGILVKRGSGPNSGTVYVVAGSAAKTGGGSLNHPAMDKGINEIGSLLLEFDGEDLTMYLVGSAPGQVLDKSVMRKHPW